MYAFYFGGASTTDLHALIAVVASENYLVPRSLSTINMVKKNKILDVVLWHKRLGHAPVNTLRNMNVF